MPEFTPEVSTGGWMILTEIIDNESDDLEMRVGYVLDPAFHPNTDALISEVGANVRLIAAAPRMYRVLKEVIEEAPIRGFSGASIDDAAEVLDWIDDRDPPKDDEWTNREGMPEFNGAFDDRS